MDISDILNMNQPAPMMSQMPPNIRQVSNDASAPPIAVVPPPPRQTMNKKTSTRTSDVTKILHANPLNDPTLEAFRQTPEYQDQARGLQDEKDFLNMQLAQGSVKDNAWLRPLIALTDSTTGSQLMKGFNPGPDQGEKNKDLLKAMTDLQKRKGDMTKELLDSLTKMKIGTDQQKAQNQTIIQVGNGSGLGDPQRRLDERQHLQIMGEVAKNTTILGNTKAANMLKNAYDNTVDSKGNIVPQQMEANQQALRIAESNARSTGNERAADYIGSVVKKWMDVKQKYGNKIESIPADDKQLNHITDLMRKTLGDIREENETEMKRIFTQGEPMYTRNPDFKQDKENFRKGNSEAFQLKLNDKVPGGQDDLNADLSKLTPEQLQDWFERHNKVNK